MSTVAVAVCGFRGSTVYSSIPWLCIRRWWRHSALECESGQWPHGHAAIVLMCASRYHLRVISVPCETDPLSFCNAHSSFAGHNHFSNNSRPVKGDNESITRSLGPQTAHLSTPPVQSCQNSWNRIQCHDDRLLSTSLPACFRLVQRVCRQVSNVVVCYSCCKGALTPRSAADSIPFVTAVFEVRQHLRTEQTSPCHAKVVLVVHTTLRHIRMLQALPGIFPFPL